LVKETISVLKEFDSVVEVHAVPGSYELPFAAKSLAVTFKYDAIITIGVLIKGQTMHFEYISSAVSDGLMRVQLETMCPVIFGVLTCLTEEQAEARAGLLEGSHNHGKDWAYAALEMVKYKKQ
jgi:6,7-dimethyl-8-ribityllumazine synthase